MMCVGTMGPGSVPLANRPSPRASMGPGPKASQPRIVSRPRNARATLRLGAQAPLIPYASFPDAPRCPDASSLECFLSRSTTSPNEIDNRLFIILVYVLPRVSRPSSNRIGRDSQQRPVRESSYIKRRTSHPSQNESHLLLPFWEEIVHSPWKVDPLSPSIKEKRITPNEVRHS